MEILIDYSELCSLLVKAGANGLIGVDAEHFPPLNDAEKQESLQAGQANYSGWEDADGEALVEALARPTAVFHATRVEENKPDENMWFFYTPGQIVCMQKVGVEQYQLAVVSGDTAQAGELRQALVISWRLVTSV